MPLLAYGIETGFGVRPARTDEFDELGALTVAAYRARDRGISPTYAAALRDVAERAGQGTVLVAADAAGTLLGGVSVLAGRRPLTAIAGPGEAEVRMLAVDPSARGRGVGAALTVAAERAARAAGAGRVVLGTPAENAVARRLYDAPATNDCPSATGVARTSTCSPTRCASLNSATSHRMTSVLVARS